MIKDIPEPLFQSYIPKLNPPKRHKPRRKTLTQKPKYNFIWGKKIWKKPTFL